MKFWHFAHTPFISFPEHASSRVSGGHSSGETKFFPYWFRTVDACSLTTIIKCNPYSMRAHKRFNYVSSQFYWNQYTTKSLRRGNSALRYDGNYVTRFYGKSLIFQLLPWYIRSLLHVENSMVLVISPLTTSSPISGCTAVMVWYNGMVTMVSWFTAKKITLSSYHCRSLQILKFQLIYMHPEVRVHERKVIGFFNSCIYQERVRCVSSMKLI